LSIPVGDEAGNSGGGRRDRINRRDAVEGERHRSDDVADTESVAVIGPFSLGDGHDETSEGEHRQGNADFLIRGSLL
jgi:hypothetical protein